MIVFDLRCSQGHGFEGWFASSSEFARQQALALVRCPRCDCSAVEKAPMAPAVPAKANRAQAPSKDVAGASHALPAQIAKALTALAEAQAQALPRSEWVGDRFADEVRSMHYGEKSEKLVHGRASRADAEALFEEGIAVAPLLVPVCPPEERN